MANPNELREKQSDKLNKLAREIELCNDEVRAGFRKALGNAIRVGELLIQAKSECHMLWMLWQRWYIPSVFGTSKYMLLAEHREFLEGQIYTIEKLAITKAIELIEDHTRKEEEGTTTKKMFEALCGAYKEANEEAGVQFHEWLGDIYGYEVVKDEPLDQKKKSTKRHQLRV